MLEKFEPNQMVRNVKKKNYDVFDKQDKSLSSLKPFWQSFSAILQDVSVGEIID